MSDIERFLGRFDEFQKWEDRQHEIINERLHAIEEKVDHLRIWKAGVVAVVSVLGGFTGYIVSLFGR